MKKLNYQSSIPTKSTLSSDLKNSLLFVASDLNTTITYNIIRGWNAFPSIDSLF